LKKAFVNMKLRPRKPAQASEPKPKRGKPEPEEQESSTSESESESSSSSSENESSESEEEGYETDEELSAYERSRRKPVACLARGTGLPPRSCQMSVAGLRKLSDFFQLAVMSDEEEVEAAKRKKLQKQADAAWRKIEPRYLEAASSGDDRFACLVAQEILPAELRTKYEPLETLSQGKSGMALRVYSLERQRNEILKVSQEDRALYKNGEVSEFELQQGAAALGLAPKVFDLSTVIVQQMPTKETVVLTVFAMEEMQVTFYDYFNRCLDDRDERQRDQMLAAMNAYLRRMKAAKVTHGDLHFDNIMLRFRPDGSYELLAIDWARAAVGVHFKAMDHLDLLLSLLLMLGSDPNQTKAKNKARLRSKAEILFKGLGLSPLLRTHMGDLKWMEEHHEEVYIDVRRAYREAALAVLRPVTAPSRPKRRTRSSKQ
jgi:hypothetical protein